MNIRPDTPVEAVPIAPAENICISITPGKTRAMPASASVPR